MKDNKEKICSTEKKETKQTEEQKAKDVCCEDNCEFCILDDPEYKKRHNIPSAPPAPDLPDF